MSFYLNRVMLIGNLTRDPETRTTTTGQTVSSFGLATTRMWKDQAGAKQEKTEFHNVVAWGKLAELCGQYLAKGRKAYVDGHLQTRDWTGDDGVKRYRTEVILENVIFLDRGGASSVGGATPSTPMNTASSAPAFPPQPQSLSDDLNPSAPSSDDIQVENIPF